jgi:hypothetical protein
MDLFLGPGLALIDHPTTGRALSDPTDACPPGSVKGRAPGARPEPDVQRARLCPASRCRRRTGAWRCQHSPSRPGAIGPHACVLRWPWKWQGHLHRGEEGPGARGKKGGGALSARAPPPRRSGEGGFLQLPSFSFFFYLQLFIIVSERSVQTLISE